MPHRITLIASLFAGLIVSFASVAADMEYLENLYRDLHANPELSFEEEQTAQKMASELRTAGFAVTENVGGHGVVGILENGSGPTVLIRADMDALPIEEKTGKPYASQIIA